VKAGEFQFFLMLSSNNRLKLNFFMKKLVLKTVYNHKNSNAVLYGLYYIHYQESSLNTITVYNLLNNN